MARRPALIAVAGLLLCVAIGVGTYSYLSQPTTLRFAVGPPNSEDARVVQAIAAQLARERANIRLRVNVIEPAAAAAAIDGHQADLAVIRRDAGMPKDGQAVAILRKNVVVFIVRSAAEPVRGRAAATDKPIEKIEEMIGRRLGVIGRSPRNIELLTAILRQYRIDPGQILVLASDDLKKPKEAGKIGVIQFDPSNVSSAIKESSVDVIMALGPIGSPIIANAIAAATRGKEQPTFLDIDASEAIAEREKVYESGEIKAGAFGGSPQRPEATIETVEVHDFIIARRMLGEQVVADFTKHLFAVRQSLAAELPSTAKFEKPDTEKDSAVPVHPGAAAYLDGELKTFFDRYSDLLYWGLMAMSVLGSGFVGLMSYTRAGDRARKLRTLERLLAIATSARSADSIEALDDLQAEIDAIQADMIEEIEANTLDQTVMTAYAMSIERAQLAISDRRTAVQGMPARPHAAVASR
jgi:TRAP-type uncharacterized transport system substrate-binding protein